MIKYKFYWNFKKYCFLILTTCFFHTLKAQFEAKPYDVLINEFMADPSPARDSLPNVEYIELYNRSNNVVQLKNWKLINGSEITVLSDFILKPNSFITLYTRKPHIDFETKDTMPVKKLIALNNAEDIFYLQDATGNIIDAVSYDISFYGDSKKAGGGWSLERINPNAPCLLDNWAASIDIKGGTPSKKNSIINLSIDKTIPQVRSVYLQDKKTVVLQFDKAMNRAALKDVSHYGLIGDLKISGVDALNTPLYDGVKLSFNTVLKTKTNYKLIVKKTLEDCTNTPLSKNDTFALRLPDKIGKDSIVINEILFDPAKGGSRFLELYNPTDSLVFDVKDLKIRDAKKNTWIAVSNSFFLAPRQFVVLTDNTTDVIKRYKADRYKNHFLKNRLPAWSSDSGSVIIAADTTMVDAFSYTKNFHNPLLAYTEGVSLERIFYKNASRDARNWQSAAASVGYATPGYENSQFEKTPSVSAKENAVFSLENATFSPDEDGFQDVLLIHYKLQKSGYFANIFVFDMQARLVKTLTINELLGTEGLIKWEGDTDEKLKAGVGVYIVLIEVTHPAGGGQKWKKAIALTSKL